MHTIEIALNRRLYFMRYSYRPTVLEIGVFRLRRCERVCTRELAWPSSVLTQSHIVKYLYSIGIYRQGDFGTAPQLIKTCVLWVGPTSRENRPSRAPDRTSQGAHCLMRPAVTQGVGSVLWNTPYLYDRLHIASLSRNSSIGGCKGFTNSFRDCSMLVCNQIKFQTLGEFSILDLLMVCSPRRLGFTTPNETLVPSPEPH
jgi:hypothetical protein